VTREEKVPGGRDMIYRLFLGLAIGGVVGAMLGYFGQCSSGACPLTANPFRGAIYGGVWGALLALMK